MQSRNRPRDPAPAMDSMDSESARLDPIAFGVALGTMLSVFVATVDLLARMGWGEEWRTLFADAYPGFEGEEDDTLVGAVWGAIDGFLAGLLTAWLYNVFRRE